MLMLVVVTGCSGLPDSKDATENWSASRLYAQARELLDSEDYQNAIKNYDTLISRYPFGLYAQQAQLDIAYAFYKDGEPDSSVAAADQFIKLYPRHEHVDYAYYVKGLANFDRGLNALDYLLKLDPADRDPRAAREALGYFGQLVRLYPKSIYAADSRQRMVYLRNNLARSDATIAGYYLQRHAYVAAANRAKYALENYPDTPANPELLAVLVRAYHQLGLSDLARDSLRILQLNYPHHPLTQAATVDY